MNPIVVADIYNPDYGWSGKIKSSRPALLAWSLRIQEILSQNKNITKQTKKICYDAFLPPLFILTHAAEDKSDCARVQMASLPTQTPA